MENKELKYKCEKCNYLTNYKSSYDKHLKSELHLFGKRKERSDKKNKKCEICNYICSTEINLINHKLIYHSTKEERELKYKYYCKKCDYGINNEVIYKKHLECKKHIVMSQL